MKQIIAATLISLTGFSATAGNISYIAPDSVTIEIEPSMNVGFANWIIPAVIVSVLVLVLIKEPDPYEQEG